MAETAVFAYDGSEDVQRQAAGAPSTWYAGIVVAVAIADRISLPLWVEDAAPHRGEQCH
jgi:hypothetical protein